MTTIKLASRWLGYLENAAAALAAIFVMAIMLLTSLDVALRYIFNSPLTFAYFLTGRYLLVGAILLSMSWGFRTGGYIRIKLLTEHLPVFARQLLLRAGLLAGAAYVAVLAWRSGAYFLHAFHEGLIFIEDRNWPVAWSWVWVPIGLILLCLRVFLTAIGPAEELDLEHNPTEET